MAQDGSQEINWAGQPFSFLPKWHQAAPHGQPQSYGQQRQQHQQGRKHAGTGTWDGPAPKGFGGPAAQEQPTTTVPVREPDSVRLSNGTLMPILGFGTFQVMQPGLVRKALDCGCRHLDCAALYFNEDMVGKELAEWVAAAPENRREDVFICSKVFCDHLRPELLRKSFEKTLSDLGCGYLDLFLIHWPDAWVPGAKNDFLGEVTLDTEVTREQTWRAMEKLVDDGLCKSIGVSNFSLKQVEEVMSFARIKPVCNQVELHPYLPQRKLVGSCFRMGVQCTAYSPLGGPNLVKPNDLITNPTVAKIAAETGKTPAQVLLKWCIQRGVPTFPKTGRPERVAENFVGMLDWKLTNSQKAALDSLECGKRFCEPPWKKWDDDAEAGVPKPSKVIQ
uniref:NADP-dependent oxidoreductase domain-containing protein n=1 Tax=Dunaliella tertiolecta TaxID=3047 RepID=A0A7S3VHV1_DUNTE